MPEILYRNILLASLLLGASTAVCAATEFKFATIAPEGSQWMQELRGAAEEVAKGSDGRVKIKYYTGGVMGNDKKVLRKIRIGQLQGGAFTASGLTERYPDIIIYGLPLIFNNEAEVDYVRARLDPVLEEGLDKAGFISLGFAGGGFANPMGAERVESLDQLRGRKIWVPEGDQISYVAMESMNLSPVVLPITDVLTGLQTGLLEFVATPPVGAVVLQWYTKVKYVTEMPLAYTLGILTVDKRAFEKLETADQVLFRDTMRRAYARVDAQNKIDNVEARKALVANGIEMVTLSPAQIDTWRSAASQANDDLVAKGVVSADILKRLLDLVAEYRRGGQALPSTTSNSVE